MKCSWPGCGRTDAEEALVVVDTGQPPWCMDHLLDDQLPPVVGGVVGRCESCGQTSVTWQVVEGQPDVCLHDRCRRNHAMGGVVTAERGAWARRRAGSGG